jgi:hypothetical protein
MGKFIELTIADEDEIKVQIINRDCVGRIYASPQNNRRSIVELNYHSISDAPVYLEVEMPFERLRLYFME